MYYKLYLTLYLAYSYNCKQFYSNFNQSRLTIVFGQLRFLHHRYLVLVILYSFMTFTSSRFWNLIRPFRSHVVAPHHSSGLIGSSSPSPIAEGPLVTQFIDLRVTPLLQVVEWNTLLYIVASFALRPYSLNFPPHFRTRTPSNLNSMRDHFIPFVLLSITLRSFRSLPCRYYCSSYPLVAPISTSASHSSFRSDGPCRVTIGPPSGFVTRPSVGLLSINLLLVSFLLVDFRVLNSVPSSTLRFILLSIKLLYECRDLMDSPISWSLLP